MRKAIIEPLERRWLAVLLVLIACLVPKWATEITSAPINADGKTNARMAVNLVHHGVLSGDEHDAPAPTMYREPLPAASAAMGVLVADRLLGPAATPEYLHGDRGRYLKYHHIAWKAIVVAGTYALIVLLTSSHVAALLGAALLGTRPNLDTLNTEIEASALLVCGIALFLAGSRRDSRMLLAAAGVAFGLLALTKAAFLYVFVGFVLVVPLVLGMRSRPTKADAMGAADRDGRGAALRRSLSTVVVPAAAFAAVILPWMTRNAMHFDSFQVSDRAGVVLYTRAVKNRMTWEEYWGSFYAWSPARVRDLVGRITGFDEADLALGARLQRFNRSESSDFAPLDEAAELSGRPEEALTFYREARAERVRLVERYSAEFPAEEAGRAADEELKQRALTEFVGAPFKHLALSVPFLWRGAGLFVPVLLAAVVLAWRKADRELLLVALLACGYVALHALLTHFEARFAAPLKPLVAALGIVLAIALGKVFLTQLGARGVARPASA